MGGEHEARVQETGERRVARGELGEHGPMNLCDESFEEGRAGNGREGSHAARVGTGVAVSRPLEVPGGRERNGAPPVADGEDRQLLAFEQLLDVKPGAERLDLRQGSLQLVL